MSQSSVCVLWGDPDASRHAVIGHGKIGQDKTIQRWRCATCETTFSCRKGTPLYYVKMDPAVIADTLWWLAEGVDISVLVRKQGYHEETLAQWLNRAVPSYAPRTRCGGSDYGVRVVPATGRQAGDSSQAPLFVRLCG